MKLFNIWDLSRVHIKINFDMLKKINKEISAKFKSKPNAHTIVFSKKEIPWTTFKNILKYSYIRDFFVPLGIYLKIVDNLNISRSEFQSSILSYKTANGRNYINNPILPINISPIFDMILAHNIGDGTVINPKKGRLPYFGYRQFNNLYRELYVKKLENIFGEIVFENRYFEKSTRPYCPPVLSSLFFKCYNLNEKSFLSKSARIPYEIFSKSKDHLLAVLIAFIIDEGHIDSTLILIKLKNKQLIFDIKKICDLLGYKSKITFGKGENEEYGSLYVMRTGMKKLYCDYLLLKEKYPLVEMGEKAKKIEDSLKIYSRPIYKMKGNDEIILSTLKLENLSVNQLAIRLNMTRQGIRFHVHKLLNNKKIKLIDKSQSNWVYGV